MNAFLSSIFLTFISIACFAQTPSNSEPTIEKVRASNATDADLVQLRKELEQLKGELNQAEELNRMLSENVAAKELQSKQLSDDERALSSRFDKLVKELQMIREQVKQGAISQEEGKPRQTAIFENLKEIQAKRQELVKGIHGE